MSNVLFLFTNDLRLIDNQALASINHDDSILPVFIYDASFYTKPLGQASKVWLHHSLIDLKQICTSLSFYKGSILEIVPLLVKKFTLEKVVVSEQFFPHEKNVINQLRSILSSLRCQFNIINTSLLWHPNDVLKDDGTPYRVFTPFYKKGCLLADEPLEPILDKSYQFFSDSDSLSIESFNFLPTHSWDKCLIKDWDISVKGAHKVLDRFLKEGIASYKDGRDFPGLQSVSRLSAYIRFGNISINQIWHYAKKIPSNKHRDHFLSELGWREFSYSLLYHFPAMTTQNLQVKFNAFPWQINQTNLEAWQQGMTGYPIVDAGMRELWQTGYMHNRIRMIVGSFLVKNLLIDWRYGESWFWDCLFDADLASNTASWQWVAGCGADAAPYFRIFNPVTQGQKFDPNGDYTLRFIPELKNLPKKYLFSPWEAPSDLLRELNITLGKTYPKPIVDLRNSRERALAAFQSLKGLS